MGEYDDGINYPKLRSVELALGLIQTAGADLATGECLIAIAAKIHDFITPTKGDDK